MATALADISSAAPAQGLSAKRRLLMSRVVSYALLAVAVILVLFPIYWMIITSLKLPREIYRVPALWPKAFTLDNFDKLLADGGFLLATRLETGSF